MVRAFLFAVAAIYIGVSAALAQQAPLPEAGHSTIGYPSVAAAFEAVKADPKIKLSSQAGWTIGVDDANHIFWAFPPPGNPAYPAAVKRYFVDKPDGIYVGMSVKCEATKAACDKLVTDFKAINAKVRQNFEKNFELKK